MEQLRMTNNFGEFPDIPAPEGWRITVSEAGDGAEWCRCCQGGFLGVEDEPSEAYFCRLMLTDPPVRRENVFYIVDEEGRVGGTATLQLNDDPTLGTIHMVGVASFARGRGLCEPICAHAMKRGKELGCTRFTLLTDDFRIPAIRSYLRLGFAPEIFDDTILERWKAILPKIGRDQIISTEGLAIR